MRSVLRSVSLGFVVAVLMAAPANADVIDFLLSGSGGSGLLPTNEVPAVTGGTGGIGPGGISLDTDTAMMSIDVRWGSGNGFTDLTGDATMMHIHGPTMDPPPTGFGFISPHWQPRASFAGTYDKKWDQTRKPLLPTDFDRRFFNAASPGLIAPGYLRGDEPVAIVNASPGDRISFNLPGVLPPWCEVELRGGKKEVLQTQLDTVISNTDEMLVFLLWRAHMVVRNGPQDVLAIEIDTKPRAANTAAV